LPGARPNAPATSLSSHLLARSPSSNVRSKRARGRRPAMSTRVRTGLVTATPYRLETSSATSTALPVHYGPGQSCACRRHDGQLYRAGHGSRAVKTMYGARRGVRKDSLRPRSQGCGQDGFPARRGRPGHGVHSLPNSPEIAVGRCPAQIGMTNPEVGCLGCRKEPPLALRQPAQPDSSLVVHTSSQHPGSDRYGPASWRTPILEPLRRPARRAL
jgi:hypothetical protein